MPEIPTAAEIAAMEGEDLYRLSLRALGWRFDGNRDCFVDADNLFVRSSFNPPQDANDAIELAEKVFDGGKNNADALGIHYHPWEKLWAGVDVAEYGDVTAPSFALAVTRAVVICWAEREREAQR